MKEKLYGWLVKAVTVRCREGERTEWGEKDRDQWSCLVRVLPQTYFPYCFLVLHKSWSQRMGQRVGGAERKQKEESRSNWACRVQVGAHASSPPHPSVFISLCPLWDFLPVCAPLSPSLPISWHLIFHLHVACLAQWSCLPKSQVYSCSKLKYNKLHVYTSVHNTESNPFPPF